MVVARLPSESQAVIIFVPGVWVKIVKVVEKVSLGITCGCGDGGRGAEGDENLGLDAERAPSSVPI